MSHRSQYKIVITLTRSEQTTLTFEQIYLLLIGLHQDIWSEELQGRGYEIEKIIVWDDEDSLSGGQLKAHRENPDTLSMYPKIRIFTATEVVKTDLEDISARIDSETQSALQSLRLGGSETRSRSAISG